jgi:predicted dehydrogenase
MDGDQSGLSRRGFGQRLGQVAAASTLATLNAPAVHGAAGNTIQFALVGCGGRGTGAVVDAFATKNGPLKLVAMADVFEDKLTRSFTSLKNRVGEGMAVQDDHKFLGFDGYQKAMDVLKPGDVVILATPPAFRWVHFDYAIKKGLNVFMEKPVTVDGPTSKKMFALGEQSVRKNLKVGVGLMCRHCDSRNELLRRIKDGQIGEIISMRAYRMHGPGGSAFTKKQVKNGITPQVVGDATQPMTEVMYQLRRFHAFLWASGGMYSDFYIHNIDETCMMKQAWPVKAQAVGGRHYRDDYVDQNFDTYSVEYTFPDGTKLHLDGRTMTGAWSEFASYAHGTKGLAIISAKDHTPARSRIYAGHNPEPGNLAWAYPENERNPYRVEWIDLIDAIRNDRPYNEVRRGVEASLVTSMGRMAAHIGRVITYDEILNSTHEFAPGLDTLTMDGPAPVVADPDGRYPVPMPGLVTDREYGVPPTTPVTSSSAQQQ